MKLKIILFCGKNKERVYIFILLFILDAKIFIDSSWQTIKDEYLVYKRYELSAEQLKKYISPLIILKIKMMYDVSAQAKSHKRYPIMQYSNDQPIIFP
jgi:hypothetical protein